MRQVTGDLWLTAANATKNQSIGNVWVCITTNGSIRKDNKAVMGAGVALQARESYPGIDLALGKLIRAYGNRTQPIGMYEVKKDCFAWMISLPVKEFWREKADLDLIDRSLKHLHKMWKETEGEPLVFLPRPGCGKGGLTWDVVKRYVENNLPEDNFIVVQN